MRITARALLLGALMVCGCAGGGGAGDGGADSGWGAVKGRVLDSAGTPVAGAVVIVTGSISTALTDAQGHYLLSVIQGPHEITIEAEGTILCGTPFLAAAGLEVDLGDLRPDSYYFVGGADWYRDGDGDGYSNGQSLRQSFQPTDYVLRESLNGTGFDCGDSDPSVHPGATEVCGDGLDNDCVGGDAPCPLTWFKDADGDGWTTGETLTTTDQPAGYVPESRIASVSALDCDDSDASVHPGAAEICGDGLDNDCDGDDAHCPLTWFKDADGDGFTTGETLTATERPAGYIPESQIISVSVLDCDDSDPFVHPGTAETCGDGVDNDCDGRDEACAECNGGPISADPPSQTAPLVAPGFPGLEMTFGMRKSAYGVNDLCIPLFLVVANRGTDAVTLSADQTSLLNALTVGLYSPGRVLSIPLAPGPGDPIEAGRVIGSGEATLLTATLGRERITLYSVPPLGGGVVTRSLSIQGPSPSTGRISVSALWFTFDVDFGDLPWARAWEPGAGVDFEPGYLIIGFRTGVLLSDAEERIRAHGCHIRGVLTQLNYWLATVAIPFDRTTDEAIADFILDPTVQYAERNWILHPQ